MQFLNSCLNCLTKNFALAWVISSTIFSIIFRLFTQVFKPFQQVLYLPSEEGFNTGSSQNSIVLGTDWSNESHYCVFLTLFVLQLNFYLRSYLFPPLFFLTEKWNCSSKIVIQTLDIWEKYSPYTCSFCLHCN